MADKQPQPPHRQSAAVEVEQIDPVDAEKVGLYLVAVLIEQETEAR
jgi:hypothetical protein